MITPGGQERGAAPAPRRIEADAAVVETFCLAEIADTQMNVPDAQSIGGLRVVADTGIGERQQTVDVELVGGHRDRSGAPLPKRWIPIGIDLDAIAFGIVEIDGFADEVIGEARQGNAIDRHMDQPAREVLACRHQESGMKEAGRVAGFGGGLRMRFERKQPHAARAELRARCGALHHRQANHIAVEVCDWIEVADPQRHHADPHRRAAGKGRPAATGASLGARCGRRSDRE